MADISIKIPDEKNVSDEMNLFTEMSTLKIYVPNQTTKEHDEFRMQILRGVVDRYRKSNPIVETKLKSNISIETQLHDFEKDANRSAQDPLTPEYYAKMTHRFSQILDVPHLQMGPKYTFANQTRRANRMVGVTALGILVLEYVALKPSGAPLDVTYSDTLLFFGTALIPSVAAHFFEKKKVANIANYNSHSNQAHVNAEKLDALIDEVYKK